MTTYGVTGATGQLGKFVLDELLQKVNAGDIIAFGRDLSKLEDYKAKGVTLRPMDYDKPDELPAALQGVDRLLLISGSALGERPRQHGNVINAAKQAGVQFIAYTSILDAENTPIKLGQEHLATEKALEQSGIDHALCRMGWYNENYVGSLGAQVEYGVITGAQGQGRISSASRADLAAGCAHVLVSGKGGETYDFAGDESWTMEEFAEEVSRQTGKDIKYQDMSEDEYAKSLVGIGLPDTIAAVVANSAHATSRNALHNDSRTLSKVTGRPTTPISETIAKALG